MHKMMNPNDLRVDYDKWQLREATDEEHSKRLADRMRNSGFDQHHPILITAKGFVIDGFHRRRAAILAGLDKVAVKVVEGTDQELLALGVAANLDHGMQLRYPQDFKIAAAKMHSMGMDIPTICDALWGRVQRNNGKHPKDNTVRGWLCLSNPASRKAGSKASEWARPIIREAGYPQTVEEAGAAIRAHVKSELVGEELDDALAILRDQLLSERETPGPTWDVEPSSASPGTPVLYISDIHGGEVVNKEELGGHNEYNWEIMKARLEHTFKTGTALLLNHMAHPEYNGFVLALGGDIVTGEIHEELKETNDKDVLSATLELSDLISGHALRLADTFGKVHIEGVPGNHGRIDKKPRAKGYTARNADYHTYMQIQRQLQRDERFTFHFPLSGEARFDVNGRRFLMVHGDQFKGGDGMIGAIGPIVRGNYKKHAAAAMWGGGAPFDTMLCGHFHQVWMAPHLIVNGSLKGYDEYAQRMGFRPERPAQMLFTVHKEHGITWFVPVYS